MQLRNAICLCLALVMPTVLPAHCPDMRAHPMLQEHSEEFKPEIVEVCEGVHVAIGYGLANAILIEGEDGVIVVDTLGSAENAIPVKKEFDKIANGRPTKAIIYTHNHADHTFGAAVFAGNDNPEVISHHSTLAELANYLGTIQAIHYHRGMHQFGNFLPDSYKVNCGIGKEQDYTREKTIALLLPTHTFEGDFLDLNIAGVRIELFHAPGETDDQIFVWLPGKKVLMPGDNFYRSFPNLYAIRGTSKRDVTGWVSSLDMMRALQPEYLVPSHTRPLHGKAEVYARLTNYRDAIQYVHDQTVFHMNQGLEPDAIVEKVKLPSNLASDPFLQEFYGRVDWSVRSIFQSYLGWFSGKCKDLIPVPLKEKAQHMADLAGGAESLKKKAEQAKASADFNWGLQLSEHLLQLQPQDPEALALKAACLKGLAEGMKSANGRNYLLTEALEAEGAVSIPAIDHNVLDVAIVKSMPLDLVLEKLKVGILKDKSIQANTLVGIYFTDIGEDYFLHVRNGIVEVQNMKAVDPDLSLEVSSIAWKELLSGLRTVESLFQDPMHSLRGDVTDLEEFLECFGGV